MKILFYRYDSLIEPHLLDCFCAAGLEVLEDRKQMQKKGRTEAEIASDMGNWMKHHSFLFVFSINFFPALSKVCEIYQVPYVCWTVDSPFLQLFSPAMKNSCNRIFFFDRAQYEHFGKPLGEGNAFYLPLGANVGRFQKTISQAGEVGRRKFRSDISFVGSLYNEKNPFAKVQLLPDYLRGYVEGLEEAQMRIYGCNLMEQMLPDRIVEEFAKYIPDLRAEEDSMEVKRYKLAHFFLGMDLAYRERVQLLSLLAKEHAVDIYTQSDAATLRGVTNKGIAKTFTEMPLIFHESKINLNITMRPIQTGLSLRVFDIIACGGFLLTNYQEELPELFEIGTEVEAFASQEELLEKARFYLANDAERERIAQRGLERAKAEHTYERRFQQMLEKLMPSV